MPDHRLLPNEIWSQVLFAVIDAPYVLDTIVSLEGCYWKSQHRYHDVEAYQASERYRVTLGQVCRAWKAFSDAQAYRWLTYDSSAKADSPHQREARAALCSDNVKQTFKPRRVLIHIRRAEDTNVLIKMFAHSSFRITTLFVDSEAAFEHGTFDLLINQSANLPNVRCLMVRPPSGNKTALSSISRAFPDLFTLSMNSVKKQAFDATSEDAFRMSNLQIFSHNVTLYPPSTLERWELSNLVSLSTPLTESRFGCPETVFVPFRLHGANLTTLNIFRIDAASFPLRFPSDFWSWCPQLKELMALFSLIYLEGPLPPEHPLRYIVHWAQMTWEMHTNIFMGTNPYLSVPVLWHNIRQLNPKFECLTISRTWPQYVEELGSRRTEEDKSAFMNTLLQICTDKGVHIEDNNGEMLSHYLSSASPSAVIEE